MTETRTKNYDAFTSTRGLKIELPKWSTDRVGATWTPGGYGSTDLPSGVFLPVSPYGGPPYLKRIMFNTDSLLDLPDDPSSEILDHVEDFWSKEQAFRDLRVTYKRGIILYGPPGSGKSATIYRLASMLVQYNAVMIMAKSAGHAQLGIELVKALEPKRKIVVILEDIDGMIRHGGDEELTHLLDGGTDVDSVLFLATTNYPERIPPRILNRPSRFDVRIRISMPSAPARRAYINHLVSSNLLVDIDEMVDATAGLSIASIKEVIILTQIFGDSITDAIAKLSALIIPDDAEAEEEEEADMEEENDDMEDRVEHSREYSAECEVVKTEE
jgi:SpoVK/Ycf46/Vps4 family AAA+-type ATPase